MHSVFTGKTDKTSFLSLSTVEQVKKKRERESIII